MNRKKSIHHSDDVANLFMKELRHEKKEAFKAVLLNAKGEILSIETVSIGDLTMAPVHPREVFCQAVKKSAAAVIFVHNHPSGDCTPSRNDIAVTDRLIEGSGIFSIELCDHIIIGDNEYYSFYENKLI